jgi:hypothetical protein
LRVFASIYVRQSNECSKRVGNQKNCPVVRRTWTGGGLPVNFELKVRPTMTGVFVALPIACAFGCAPTSPAAPISLCEVRDSVARFVQQPIVFHAEIDGDGERTIAIDPECPELAIAVKYSNTELQNGDAERIGSAIRDKLFTPNVGSISATIHGTFVTARKSDEATAVIVDRLENFQVSRPNEQQ